MPDALVRVRPLAALADLVDPACVVLVVLVVRALALAGGDVLFLVADVRVLVVRRGSQLLLDLLRLWRGTKLSLARRTKRFLGSVGTRRGFLALLVLERRSLGLGWALDLVVEGLALGLLGDALRREIPGTLRERDGLEPRSPP